MGHQQPPRDRQQPRSGVPRKKPWQPKGGRPRLRVAGSDGKPRRLSVEQAVKGLRRLQLQAVKDLRLALRNARQFEIRKVCRRQRLQEERCKTAEAGNADETASLQKGLAKLSSQLQALKILSVSAVLPLAVVRAGLPPALLKDARDKADPAVEPPPAGGAEAQPWAVERVLAAHVVQQAIQKFQLEQRKQEQAVTVAQSRKEKRQEARQAREHAREEGGGGGPPEQAGQARSQGHAAGSESDGEEDEETWGEDAARALMRLQSRNRGSAQEEPTASGNSSSEAGSASEGELGQQAGREGATWAAGEMEEGSISGSESDGKAGGSGDEGPRAAGPSRGAAERKAGPKKKGKKNRLGQRERRRLVAAGMPQAGHRGASSKLQGRPGRGAPAQAPAQKHRRPATGSAPGTRLRPSVAGSARSHSLSGKRVTAHGASVSTEGLHPSWAARRAQAGGLKQTVPRKKVVFDEEGRPKAAVTPSHGQNGSRDNESQKRAEGGAASLHPSWAAKRAQAQKTALAAAPAASKKIKFDD